MLFKLEKDQIIKRGKIYVLAYFDDLKNIIRDFLIAYNILSMVTRCFWSFNWTIALQIDLNDVN